jgi:hypothetical protein
MLGLTAGVESEGLSPCVPYCAVSGRCQDDILAVQMGIDRDMVISGLTVGGTGNTHRRLVHQQDRQNQNKRNL